MLDLLLGALVLEALKLSLVAGLQLIPPALQLVRLQLQAADPRDLGSQLLDVLLVAAVSLAQLLCQLSRSDGALQALPQRGRFLCTGAPGGSAGRRKGCTGKEGKKAQPK